MEKNGPPLENERFCNPLQRKHVTYLKTMKKSLPDENKNETLPLSGQKIQYISFWRKNVKK